MNEFSITRTSIDAVLPTLARGLAKYEWLQAELPRRDVAIDRDFQRHFNGFYRVRRGIQWQRTFYELLQAGKTRHPTLSATLLALYAATDRVEASFASKLIATLDTAQPIIDSVVLRHVALKLPVAGALPVRVERIVAIHQILAASVTACLAAPVGKYLVSGFRRCYPQSAVTEVKMLDLVLWQTRGAALQAHAPDVARPRPFFELAIGPVWQGVPCSAPRHAGDARALDHRTYP